MVYLHLKEKEKQSYMKKRIYFFALLLTGVVFAGLNDLYAQRRNRAPLIRLGVRAGFNMSDLTSAKGLDIYNGLAYYDASLNYIGFTDTEPFKYGFNAGLALQAEISDSWFLQANLLYYTKGYKLNTQNVEISATANYLQIPVSMVYKYELSDDWRILASAGAFVGVGLHGFTDFEDHYGEEKSPRPQHITTNTPTINPETGQSNLICFEPTVHGATYWKDRNDTFATTGTWSVDAGFEVGLGVEYKSFQFMINYQISALPLYDYNKEFKSRYETKNIDAVNSFDYFGIEAPMSPRQHVISFNITYFFDNWDHGIRW